MLISLPSLHLEGTVHRLVICGAVFRGTVVCFENAMYNKDSIGYRLVQRKYAQGVPVPASHVAPQPPERRTEPATVVKIVYQNNISARNLLDFVSIQTGDVASNVTREAGPVFLPYDRPKGEVAAPADSVVHATPAGPVAPPPTINGTATTPEPEANDGDTNRPTGLTRPSRRRERSPDRRRPLRRSSRRARDGGPAPTGGPGMRLRSPAGPSRRRERSPDRRRPLRRSSRRARDGGPAPTGGPGMRLRSPAVKKAKSAPYPATRSRGAEAASGPPAAAAAASGARRSPQPEIATSKLTKKNLKKLPNMYLKKAKSAPYPATRSRGAEAASGPPAAAAAASGARRSPQPEIATSGLTKRDLKRLSNMSLKKAKSAPYPATRSRGAEAASGPPAAAAAASGARRSPQPEIATSGLTKRDLKRLSNMSPTRSRGAEAASGPPAAAAAASGARRSPQPEIATSGLTKRDLKRLSNMSPVSSDWSRGTSPFTLHWSDSSRPPSPECPAQTYVYIHEVVHDSMAPTPRLTTRCRKCQQCKTIRKVLQLKDLVGPEAVNPGSIYEFHTELEEAMCPSLSTLRSRRRLSRTAGKHIYLDIFPPGSPHILQILCKTTDQRTVSAVRLVDRDVAVDAYHQPLKQYAHLIDSLLDCMSRRAKLNDKEKEESPKTEKRAKLMKRRNTIKEVPKTNGLHAVDATAEAKSPNLEQATTSTQSASTSKANVFKSPKTPSKPRASSPAPSVAQSDDDVESVIGRNQPAGTVVDAPVFRPTAAEFQDPIAYYKKIRPYGAKYGLCKIIPPEGFTAPCVLDDHIRFAVIYQYIFKLYARWGPVARELAAIKMLLRSQNVAFDRAPLLNGCQVNLLKLYHAVERHGGLTRVIQRKRWGRVAEDMKLPNLQNPEKKLDKIYMKFLLPYASLSDRERQAIVTKVEKYWSKKKYNKMLARARNPLHAQNRLLDTLDSSSDESDGDTAGALEEAEDCITQGRSMNLLTFRKVATAFMEAQFPSGCPETAEVERAYWRAVLLASDYIVANTASIDTGEAGLGFPKDPNAPCGTHPWNLKMLASNPGNVLRFLGPVLGVTVPTLHLSMLYSTCCWHRDPHGLPWVEYLHTGPDKIWYGIPSSQSNNFRRAVETLCPAYCQNKSIWLASDIAMIPPEMLSEHGVALSRAEQRPGEFVMVFPEAHSCSVTTGFSVSESVYFAPDTWMDTVQKLFEDLRSSCEPTMFSLEQLLLNGAEQLGGAAARVLATLLRTELRHRSELAAQGVPMIVLAKPAGEQHARYTSGADECEYCRATLYLSKVVSVPARRSPLCPEHALLLMTRSCVVGVLELHSAHSNERLQALLARLPGEANGHPY